MKQRPPSLSSNELLGALTGLHFIDSFSQSSVTAEAAHTGLFSSVNGVPCLAPHDGSTPLSPRDDSAIKPKLNGHF